MPTLTDSNSGLPAFHLPTAPSAQIEPGILGVFRLFVGIQCVLLTLGLCSAFSPNQPIPDYFTFLTWGQIVFMVIYLGWNWLRRVLGAVYLPLALAVISIAPIVSLALSTQWRLDAGAWLNDPLSDHVRLYGWLIVPLLLLSMQYGMRILLLYTVGTSFLPLLLVPSAIQQNSAMMLEIQGHSFTRLLLFLVAGYVVVRISKAQRQQRAELAQKNAQLVHYAATLEQLAISQERNRMARELHDTLAHTLSAVSVQLKALEVLWESDPATAQRTLKQLQDLTRNGLTESRRALHALRASPIEELGLGLAVRRHAELVAERSRLKLSVDIPPQLPVLKPEIEQQLYRIAEEALNNVARHANAQTVAVKLKWDTQGLCLSVTDDGIGFDAAQPSPNGRYGLTGMHERALLIDGALDIRRNVPHGTQVVLNVPIRV